jgi:hypothetical protein
VRMMRGALWSSACLLGLVSGVGCQGASTKQARPTPTVTVTQSVASTPPATVAATETVIFTPFAPGGALIPRFKVTARATGSCQASNVLQRGDAYRCFLDSNVANRGTIADPCFASDWGFLACVLSPTSRTVLKVKPNESLTAPAMGSDSTKGNAWFLKLANGQICGFAQGGTTTLNGVRLNYFCDDGAALYGGPNKAASVWTIYRLPKASTYMTQMAVVKAWY